MKLIKTTLVLASLGLIPTANAATVSEYYSIDQELTTATHDSDFSTIIDLNSLMNGGLNPDTGDEFIFSSVSFRLLFSQSDYLVTNDAFNYGTYTATGDSNTAPTSISYSPYEYDGTTYDYVVNLAQFDSYTSTFPEASAEFSISGDVDSVSNNTGFGQTSDYEYQGQSYNVPVQGNGEVLEITSIYNEYLIPDSSDYFTLNGGSSISTNGIYTVAASATSEYLTLQGMSLSFSYEINPDYVAYISPVPEASTLSLMMAGLGLVGFMSYRRRKII